jgi:hypothetical protein
MYRMNGVTAARAFALLLVIAAVACKKKDEAAYPPAGDTTTAIVPAAAVLHVTEIDVGKGLNPDKTVRDKTDNFGVRDTVYVAVKTEGSSTAPAKLAAKWTFQDGQTVNETSTDIAPNTGEARHEFHILKGTAWPKGNYKVEVTLDGTSAGTKDFSIK